MKIALPMHLGDTVCKINNAYIKYISAAGHTPVLFTKMNNVEEIAAQCDGLLLPGGIDIDPTFYGHNNVASNYCSPDRDNFERRSMRAFMAENKKVMGICRGFQLMVREFLLHEEEMCKGMFFMQHVNDHSLVSARSVDRSVLTHSVYANTAALYGEGDKNEIFINSIHHQALVVQQESQLNVTANKDNKLRSLAVTNFGAPKVLNKTAIIVEAVDIVLDGASLRGVQWHPEELMDTALMNTFFLGEGNDAPLTKSKLQ